MIRYALRCTKGHRFESWFQNAGAFDALARGGRVICPDCGSADVEKCLMTPDVRSGHAGGEGAATHEAQPSAPAPALTPDSAQQKAIAALKRKIEAESDYVGADFAHEARAIHDGAAPERPIYGEARVGEAMALIEDGVPVAPLPFRPTRKIN